MPLIKPVICQSLRSETRVLFFEENWTFDMKQTPPPPLFAQQSIFMMLHSSSSAAVSYRISTSSTEQGINWYPRASTGRPRPGPVAPSRTQTSTGRQKEQNELGYSRRRTWSGCDCACCCCRRSSSSPSCLRREQKYCVDFKLSVIAKQ